MESALQLKVTYEDDSARWIDYSIPISAYGVYFGAQPRPPSPSVQLDEALGSLRSTIASCPLCLKRGSDAPPL